MKDETIKARLLEKLNQLLDERIIATEQSIQSAKESRDNDTKSSAGDKYETGREMIQQEMDKQSAQLAKNRALKNDLARINPANVFTQAGFGSVVICNSGCYFLSIPFGKIELAGSNYFCLSLASPIGQLLLGKKAGDVLDFNGQKVELKEVF
ncbi:hypothetical protein [Mangrovibacterium sp.]|uniref:hypothetical protein n=1 Tax=Mangrovibacterium sp. TaxID=1961364 RepID=UPI0035633252